MLSTITHSIQRGTKILFDTRILAPSDLLRLIPFVGMRLRKSYTDLVKNVITKQFVFKVQLN